VVFLLACAAAPAPDLDTMVSGFLTAQDLSPEDCGSVTIDASGTCTEAAGAAWTCLADAWSTCTPTQLKITSTTIEGDPIPSVYVVYDDAGTCVIERFQDTTADAFGVYEISEATCSTVEVVGDTANCDVLRMSDCALVDCQGEGDCT
jgi:hypothetical protein